MSIQEAVRLINNPIFSSLSNAGEWADLGAGNGVFTQALAQILPPKSKIHAVDLDARFLFRIPARVKDVNIYHHQADFKAFSFETSLDGILMANSIHYVEDKHSLLQHLSSFLHPKGILLIIEYDTTRSNQWVPYPIPFHNLIQLGLECGFETFQKVGEKPSIYGNGNIYAAITKWKI